MSIVPKARRNQNHTSQDNSNTQTIGLQRLNCYVRVGPHAAAAAAQTANPHQLRRPLAVDYVELLNRHKHGACPALFLAPMENLMDRACRQALKAAIGARVSRHTCLVLLKLVTHTHVDRYRGL